MRCIIAKIGGYTSFFVLGGFKIDLIIYLWYINLIIKYIRFTPDNYIMVIGLFLCY